MKALKPTSHPEKFGSSEDRLAWMKSHSFSPWDSKNGWTRSGAHRKCRLCGTIYLDGSADGYVPHLWRGVSWDGKRDGVPALGTCDEIVVQEVLES